MATGPLIEEVATNLEEVASATRTLNAQGIGFFVAGVAVGVGIGFYFGYRWNREKIRAEIFKEAEQTISDIREVYRSTYETAISPEITTIPEEKPPLDEVVEQRGYSMKVTEEEVEEFDPSQRPLKAPVPVAEPTPSLGQLLKGDKEKDDGWDYTVELAQRGDELPYIIHQNEYALNETDYTQTTYTYYADDEVLVDTDDTPITNVDSNVGLNNLTRFGHGADDFNVLYIRNPKLELEMEICRIPKSYAEEVEGLEHSDSPGFERMPRRRIGFDDDRES